MITPRIGPVHALEKIQLRIILSNSRVSGKIFSVSQVTFNTIALRIGLVHT